MAVFAYMDGNALLCYITDIMAAKRDTKGDILLTNVSDEVNEKLFCIQYALTKKKSKSKMVSRQEAIQTVLRKIDCDKL